jgi:F-type H+-transporting ATPase subunit delta
MSVSKNYARALLESAQTPAELAAVRESMEQLVAALDESKDFRISLMSPALSSRDRTDLIHSISKKFGFPAVMTHFLDLLNRKGRLPILLEIQSSLEEVAVESQGGLMGVVSSADEIKTEDVADLANAFGRKLGKKVSFRVVRDPALLAGLKVTIGGVTYDGTLRSQLDRIGAELSQGGATH